MPARAKSAALPGAPFATIIVSPRSVAPTGKTTTVIWALCNEGVIRNGQEEKGHQEVAEKEGRQIVQEVGGKEARCQKIAKEEGLEGQAASGRADPRGPIAGTREFLRLRSG